MNYFDQFMLLLTGLVAIYLLQFFKREYKSTNQQHNIYYMMSFAVLLISGLLLIGLGYEILSNPLVVVVAAVIPLALALGLISEFFPQSERYYLLFVIVGLFAIAITRLGGPSGTATAVLATVHSIAGLTIFLTPIHVSRQGKTPWSFVWVTIGGTLIGIGGISLAFLKAGSPILSEELIFTILAPLLFLMAAAFAFGFIKKDSGKSLSA